MSFTKKQIPQYPRRHWQIVGRAGSGKSTFAMRMRSPLLPIDADHRIDQVAPLNPDMLELSTIPTDHNDTDRISQLLNKNMPGTAVGTIIVDSLTALIAPLVTQAMADKAAGRAKNLWAAFLPKALAMRQLQDAVTKWGCDTLWIFHLDDTSNDAGDKIVKETISKTELARLMRSVNLKLEVVIDKGKRGIFVKWARRGRAGKQVGILWDETGTWIGMPERIEAAVYDGLTPADQDQIETTLPESFPDDATAIGWGLEQGAFNALEHARNAYEKLMREHDEPEDMEDRTALWLGDVLTRLEAKKQNGNGNGHSDGVRELVVSTETRTPSTPPTGAPATSQPAPAPTTPVTSHGFWTRAIELKKRGDAQAFIKANTVDGTTDWTAALRDLEAKFGAGAGR